jgi:curved DNA-binding protein
MATEFKDYYASLDVSREATDDEIKQAFRKLARRYHPDVAKDKLAAEEKFKEINEANEVLGDPTKRKKYDELGMRWAEEGAGAAAGEWSRGFGGADFANAGRGHEFHFSGTGFSDFFEQFFGGAGFAAGAAPFASTPGARTGPHRGLDVEGDILVTLAEVMHGTVRPISLRTRDPQTGQSETHAFSVRIPPGAEEGRRIRVPGKGEPGTDGGAAGDLYLRVKYAAHPDLRVRGADLYQEVELAPWDAVLGASVVVSSLDGPVRVRILPGTQAGRHLRVRGLGLPKGRSGGRGDLYVVVGIDVPHHPTATERAAWEKLREAARSTRGNGNERPHGEAQSN